MPNTMTVMTNWNEVFDNSVFSIPVYMVDNKYPVVCYITIITFLFIYLPCIVSITSGFLVLYGISIPIFYSAFIGTKFSFYKKVFRAIKYYLAFFALNIFTRLVAYFSAIARAMFLSHCPGFFAYKFNLAYFANIFYSWFKSINSPAFVATSYISFSVAKWNRKLYTTYWANFSYFFHERIVA